MKRYLLSFLFAFSTFVVNAQTADEHLRFMGIQMSGPIQTFVQKLEAKGLEIDAKDDDGNYYLNGTFFNESNCRIYIGGTAGTLHVYRAGVSFSPDNNWASLTRKYYRLKEALTEKYGKPSFSIEEFTDGEPSSERAKFRALDNGKCRYKAQFILEEGWISLDIVSEKGADDRTYYVHLLYVDEKNEATEKRNAYDDL